MILPRMHFFGMYFAETSALSPLYFAQNAFFWYVFCRNLYAFSIVFCPECMINLSINGKNLTWQIFDGKKPHIKLFWLGYLPVLDTASSQLTHGKRMDCTLSFCFSKNSEPQDWKAKNSCKMAAKCIDGLSWSILFFKRGLEYIFILRFGHCILNSGLEKNMMDWKNQLWIVYPLAKDFSDIKKWASR